MNLVDLHRHLDGSIRPSTLAELAGGEVPADLTFRPGMTLDAALARFGFVVALLQSDAVLRRVAGEVVADAEADGVAVLEIRFAPFLHHDPARAIDAVLDGLGGRAGLVLCGLYGDDPAVLDTLVDLAASRPGVVGLDLAGGPSPTHGFHLRSYAEPFARAARIGLGRTVHAAEGRPASEIRTAIEVLGAQRIGHGTTLLDDPAVVDLVLDRGVTIEACPTSNVHTGVIARVADHPVVRWLRLGIRCCVNTDNTYFSDVTASEELARVRRIPGFVDADAATLLAAGAAAAFPTR